MNPAKWLNNFDDEDKGTAAFLLDKFVFYNIELSNILLKSSYNYLGDGFPRGPTNMTASEILHSLPNAYYLPVEGENPRPTDSGNYICRMSRQILRVPDENIVLPDVAVSHAEAGNQVIFFDDFIGSGDQFLKTWRRPYNDRNGNVRSFSDIATNRPFVAIYIALVSTDFGLGEINKHAPLVTVSVSHLLGDESTIFGMKISDTKKLKLRHY